MAVALGERVGMRFGSRAACDRGMSGDDLGTCRHVTLAFADGAYRNAFDSLSRAEPWHIGEGPRP